MQNILNTTHYYIIIAFCNILEMKEGFTLFILMYRKTSNKRRDSNRRRPPIDAGCLGVLKLISAGPLINAGSLINAGL